jgi:hypothetical protein
MRMQSRSMGLAVLLPLLFACGSDSRTLVVSGELEVQRNFGLSGVVGMEGRLRDNMIPEGEFNTAWNLVTRASQAAEGLAITLAGRTPPDGSFTSLQAGLVLVIPTPLSAGRVYDVTHVLTITTDALPIHWAYWGPRILSNEGQADIGFRALDHLGIGNALANVHHALWVTGTVEVLRRRGEQVDLRLDVTTSDTTEFGIRRDVILRGDFSIAPQGYTPPIS